MSKSEGLSILTNFWLVTRKFLEAGIVRFISVGFTGLAGVFISRSLSLEERGRYFYILSAIALISQFLTFGLHSGNAWLVARDPENRFFAVLLTVVTGFMASLGVGVWLIVTSEVSGVFLFVAMFFSLTFSLSWVLQPTVVALEEYRVYSYALLVQGGILCLGVFFLVSTIENLSGLHFLAVGSIGYGLSSFFMVLKIVGSKNKGIWDVLVEILFSSQRVKQSVLEVLLYCWRAYLICLVGVAVVRIGPLLLGSYNKESELGEFAIAQQIVDLLAIGPTTIALLIFPRLVKSPIGNIKRMLKVASINFFLALVFAGLAWLAFPLLIEFVFGSHYEGAGPVYVSLIPGFVAGSVLSIFSQKIAADGFPVSLVYVWLFMGSCYAIFIGIVGERSTSEMLGWSYSALMICLLIPIGCISFGNSGGRKGKQA